MFCSTFRALTAESIARSIARIYCGKDFNLYNEQILPVDKNAS